MGQAHQPLAPIFILSWKPIFQRDIQHLRLSYTHHHLSATLYKGDKTKRIKVE